MQLQGPLRLASSGYNAASAGASLAPGPLAFLGDPLDRLTGGSAGDGAGRI